MSEAQRWLDGNAVAGLLAEVFEADVTATVRTCSACNRDHPVGAHRAYRGAGVVLRCPSCGAVAVRICLSPEPRAT